MCDKNLNFSQTICTQNVYCSREQRDRDRERNIYQKMFQQTPKPPSIPQKTNELIKKSKQEIQ